MWENRTQNVRMLCRNDHRRNRAPNSTMERGLECKKEEDPGGSQGRASRKTSPDYAHQNGRRGYAGSSSGLVEGSAGNRCLGTRHRRLGFLRGCDPPQSGAYRIICGMKGKRKAGQEETCHTKRVREEPQCGKRPIVQMILCWGNREKSVRVLLDTGCSVPLVTQRLVQEEDQSIRSQKTNWKPSGNGSRKCSEQEKSDGPRRQQVPPSCSSQNHTGEVFGCAWTTEL